MSGTGPGTFTDDGCSVELYRLLPAMGETELVGSVAAPSATVLDLGCGAGRIANPLAEAGFAVTAVDGSPEMLAHVHGCDAVLSGIERLDLARSFDVVLLASHLVNVPDAELRRRLLATCARHVDPRGSVLIQWHPPEWFEDATDSWASSGGMRSRLRDIHRPEPDLLTATAEYVVGAETWTHTFTAARLSDERLRDLLLSEGLAMVSFMTDDRRWVRAELVA